MKKYSILYLAIAVILTISPASFSQELTQKDLESLDGHFHEIYDNYLHDGRKSLYVETEKPSSLPAKNMNRIDEQLDENDQTLVKKQCFDNLTREIAFEYGQTSERNPKLFSFGNAFYTNGEISFDNIEKSEISFDEKSGLSVIKFTLKQAPKAMPENKVYYLAAKVGYKISNYEFSNMDEAQLKKLRIKADTKVSIVSCEVLPSTNNTPVIFPMDGQRKSLATQENLKGKRFNYGYKEAFAFYYK